MRPPAGLSKNILCLFPAQQLVHEIFQLRPERVAGGKHPDGPAVFHHRHVPEVALVHDVQRMRERPVRMDGLGVAGHHVGERACVG